MMEAEFDSRSLHDYCICYNFLHLDQGNPAYCCITWAVDDVQSIVCYAIKCKAYCECYAVKCRGLFDCVIVELAAAAS